MSDSQQSNVYCATLNNIHKICLLADNEKNPLDWFGIKIFIVSKFVIFCLQRFRDYLYNFNFDTSANKID